MRWWGESMGSIGDEGARSVISSQQWELEAERAAHRETQAYLQRALRMAGYYRRQAEQMQAELPYSPEPNQPTEPNRTNDQAHALVDGDGGGVVLMMAVCEVAGVLAQATRMLASYLRQVPPGQPAMSQLIEVQRGLAPVLAQLEAHLTAATGTPTAPAPPATPTPMRP